LKPLLEIVDNEALIILADARGVALNVPENDLAATAAIDHFISTFKDMTKNAPHAKEWF
jgi:hypothetical protein